MESIRNSMDPRAKEKQEEHEDSKKEEPKQPVIVSKSHKITKPDMNSLKAIKQRN